MRHTNKIIEYIYAYYLAGLFSGFLHYYLDTYDNKIFKKYHSNFRTHHIVPLSLENYSYFCQLTEILPIIIICYIILTKFKFNKKMLIKIGFLGNLSQIVHKFSHRRKHNLNVPYFVKKLQDYKIILHPDEHSKHHQMEIEKFCILHSNSDKLFEYLFIEILNFPVSKFITNNNKLKKINKYERAKILGSHTKFIDVLKEQKILILCLLLNYKLK